MADLGENPKQQGESSEQRKGKGKRKVMESGSDEAGNESKGRSGRHSLGRTDEEKRRLKNEADRKSRAKKKAEFQWMQTTVNDTQTREKELSASLEVALEDMKNMKAEHEKQKNEYEAYVLVLQNQLKDTSAALQYMTAESQSWQEKVKSMIDMFLNQNGNQLPEFPVGLLDGLDLPNYQELQDFYNIVPNELGGAIQTPNIIINAEASTSTTHNNEENVRLQKEVDELKRKVEIVESALLRITAKP